MTTKNIIDENSPSVQFHLSTLQSVIQRMAANSSASKNWCITLVSAILVLMVDKGKLEYAFLALIPTILFLFIDTYYISLERGFRNSYNSFVIELHNQNLDKSNLFMIKSEGKMICLFLSSFGSFSIWPFYGSIVSMILFFTWIGNYCFK